MAKKYYFEEEIIKVPRFEEKEGFYTTKQRSKAMSKVKSKNSIPELMLRKVLWARGVRYRIHVKSLSGKPDLVMRKFKLVIFIDGGFWHGYHWEFKKERLKTNRAFWIPKIERNMQRDFFNNKVLREAGYTVMRFWDHEVKNNLERCVNQVLLYMEAVNNGKIPEVG